MADAVATALGAAEPALAEAGQTEGTRRVRPEPVPAPGLTGQVMAKLSRREGAWEMTAIGDKTHGRTFHDMMPAILSHL